MLPLEPALGAKALSSNFNGYPNRSFSKIFAFKCISQFRLHLLIIKLLIAALHNTYSPPEGKTKGVFIFALFIIIAANSTILIILYIITLKL
jgi:hypothetical protein